MEEKPTYKEAFLFWLKLGFISFGGPVGQIAIMREFLVDKRKWISDNKFLHALNYCYLLPGPEAQQLATYIGWLLHGTKGGITAGVLFILPSIFILLTLSILYAVFGSIPIVISMFNGLRPAVVAIVILALYKITQKSLQTPLHYVLAIASFIAIFFFNVLFPYIIVASIIIGIIAQKLFPKLNKQTEKSKQATNEEGYYLNSNSKIPGTEFNTKRLLRQIVVLLVLWCLPFVLFYFLTDNFKFWSNMSMFFTQAAFVTFGGAYAVLPYVAQVSVSQFGWLSKGQMIDGFALGETTPGPLIMILAFVGFMGGYNIFNHSILSGTIGLLTTTYYTFLPCFLFIFVGAPIIEKTQDNTKIKSVLSIVTASVVGVILNLTVYFGIVVLFPKGVDFVLMDYTSLIWIIISVIALHKFKVDMILWIGISAVYGFFHNYLLSFG